MNPIPDPHDDWRHTIQMYRAENRKPEGMKQRVLNGLRWIAVWFRICPGCWLPLGKCDCIFRAREQ